MTLLCLVPTPLRALRVTRRLCDAQGGALFGRQATTFDALAASLVAASGDRRPVLGPLGERLLAVEVGREAGGPFASLGAADGLAGSLAAALGELRRGEVTAADALAAARTLEGAARVRLEGLSAALGAWERRLEALGVLDRPGAIRAAAAAARGRVTVAETEAPALLVLDGFASLSSAEWDLFATVAARAGAVRVHLPHLADLPAATSAAEPLARRVEALHELAAARSVEIIAERVDDPARAGRIAALLAGAAGGAPPVAGGGGQVRATCFAEEEAEAQAAARTAAEWAEAGIPPEEIRLFSPSPGQDAARLARAFAGVGLPFSAGRGAPLAEVPAVRIVREALAAAGGLERAGAERLLRSSYLALGAPVEGLSALLDRAGAIGGRRGPAEALRGRLAGVEGGRERAAAGRAARRLDALGAILAPLDQVATARRHAALLSAFLDASGIRRRAARAERELASRDLRALARLADAAEEASRSLALLGRGEERLSPREWRAVLDAALAGGSLPATGEPFGGAVELLALEDAPGESARAALLIGCSRRRLPAPVPPEPVLREPERRALGALLKRGAVPSAASRRAEARHRALCAVGAAREAIHFSWLAEEGGAPLVEAALAAVGVATPVDPAPPPGLAASRAPGERLRAATRRASRGEEGIDAALGAALASRLDGALDRGGVEAARRAAVERREAAPFAGAVGAAELEEALPAEWTPSQLEGYARCPFRLLLGVGVGLPSREGAGADIDPRDEGQLVHAALERYVAARVARGAWPPSGDAGDRDEARDAVDALFAVFESAGRTGDPAVWAAKRRAVRARVVRWVEAEARDADGLVPRLLEHAFGGRSGRPPLRFGEGAAAVAVRGRIDRVDADGRRLRVIDYKNSRASADRKALLDPEAFGVTSFQIPIYLAAAARELPACREVGATLALLRDGERLAPFTGSAEELGEGPLGARLAEAVVGTVARARAGEFPIASRGCDRCDFGAVCRFQGVAEGDAAVEG